MILEIAITSLGAVAIRAFLSPEQGTVRLRSAVLSQLAVNAVTPTGNLGLVLVTAGETVKRARERQVERAAASGLVPVLPEVRIVTAARPVAPAPVAKAAD